MNTPALLQKNSQREILETISSLEELSKITRTLLEELKMTDILTISPSFIQAKFDLPALGEQVFGFYVIEEALKPSGSPFEEVELFINDKLRLNYYSKIYIVSNQYISNSVKINLLKGQGKNLIDFWDRDELTIKINTHYPDYWRHGDLELIGYEKGYSSELHDDWSFGRVKQFKASYEKLYNIYIEPKLFLKSRDKESSKESFVSCNLDRVKNAPTSAIIEGPSGSGKTRLMRELGHLLIKENPVKKGKKHLPIILSVTKLIDTRTTEVKTSLFTAILSKFGQYFSHTRIEEFLSKYYLVVMIDSIDELDAETQSSILTEAKSIIKQGGRVFLGTRNISTEIAGIENLERREEFVINKFSSKQVRQFLSRYFSNNNNKADNLIQSLQENRILERLPITPLNLSLISILYEENNFEIPATITDIYDNFNNLLLGRATVDSRLEFFDISIKERILAKYALELLERKEGKSMTKDEFLTYFRTFFQPIAGTIKLELLDVLLDHLISSTGLLTLEEDKYVRFRHESYLEYYASREIFLHQREKYEPILIDNFLDISWQYAAIFYAGRMKDAPTFLQKIVDRAQNAKTIAEAWNGVYGLGYITQALYLTENATRKKAVDTALDLSILTLDGMKLLGSNEVAFYKSLTLPVVSIISSMLFMDSFNSITVKSPLSQAFDELFTIYSNDEDNKDDKLKLREDVKNNYAFKLFSLALTLANGRLKENSQMEKLVFKTKLLDDPFYHDLLSFGTSIASSKELYRIKDEALKPKSSRHDKRSFFIPNNVANILSQKPAGALRFTGYDRIKSIKRIRIYTEGKTDALIIEHAFVVLTNQIPYWNISPVGIDALRTGAHALSSMLTAAPDLLENDEIVIGIFDNDEKGCQEFNGLKRGEFAIWNEDCRIKKSVNKNVFALKLPIPPEKEQYYQKDQRFSIFAIEHYFPVEFLNQHKMLDSAPMPGTYKISGNKSEFSKAVVKSREKYIFADFIYLFRNIDSITSKDDIEYE